MAEQVLPLHVGVRGVLVLAGSVVNTYTLPLFGPLYVKVTVLPAVMVVGDALRATGIIVSVVDAGCEFVVPEVATAWKVVVLVGMPVSV